MTTAQDYLRNGINIIRLQLDGSKQPVGSWQVYQQRLLSAWEAQEWWGNGQACGMAAVTGSISENLHVVDIDYHPKEVLDKLFAHLPDIMQLLVIVRTPRPGLQLWFRQETQPAGGQTLAWTEPLPVEGTDQLQPRAMIETRGQGNYVCCPGTPPETHKRNQPYEFVQGSEATIPILSDEEVEQLFDACCSYSRYTPKHVQIGVAEQYIGEPRPGDVYNQQGSLEQLLLAAGWTVHAERNGRALLTRPGKDPQQGASASFNYLTADNDKPLLHVFSSNAAPFEAGQTYDAFGAYTALHHAGDYGRAAAKVRQDYQPQVQQAQQQYAADSEGELTVVAFSQIQPKPVHWLWHTRFALGKLTQLSGDGGLGKSMLTIDMAARITQRRLFPDGSPSLYGSCFFVGSEDGAEDTVRPRLDAAGADISKVQLLAGPKPKDSEYPSPLDLSRHIEKLDSTLQRYPDAVLLTIDPVLDYLGRDCDSHKAEDVRRVLAPLRLLAEKHNISIVLINHLNKDSKARSKSRAMGSGALNHVCRVELRVTEDREDEERRLLLPVKNNLAKAAGLAFRIESTAQDVGYIEWETGTVDVTISQVESEQLSSKVDEALDWLAAQLADGPAMSKELKKTSGSDGLSWASVRRAQEKLKVKPFKDGEAWYWQLPD